MYEELSQLIDESIKLELNVAELYKIFDEAFPEDAYFWSKLLMEEENHAALIRGVAETYDLSVEFTADMLFPSLQDLKNANSKIVSLIVEYRSNPPSRETAFNVALELEQSSGEIHFQRFMEKESNDRIIQVYQQLNKDNKNHAARLRSYMEKHGIQK